MTKLGLLVRLKAKPGQEKAVAEFLREAMDLVRAEEYLPVWFGLAGANGTFYIFDAFDDEAGRERHLAGRVAGGLMQQAPELLAEPPHIEKLDVLAAKILSGAVN